MNGYQMKLLMKLVKSQMDMLDDFASENDINDLMFELLCIYTELNKMYDEIYGDL